jgi:hypothetical protein
LNWGSFVDCHRELMGWIPPPDGIAMCQTENGGEITLPPA